MRQGSGNDKIDFWFFACSLVYDVKVKIPTLSREKRDTRVGHPL